MQVLRLHDAARRPPSWTGFVRPDQFVAFLSDAASGAPLDGASGELSAPGEANCIVFETLADAQAFCDASVERIPSARCEVFAGPGRVESPLLSVLHPARAARLETAPRAARLRVILAVLLLVGAIPLIYYDTWTQRGVLVLPTFLGCSMILAAARLLFLNQAIRETERRRLDRLARHR